MKHYCANCQNIDYYFPILDTLHLIGSKWIMPILLILDSNGVMRYNELRRSLESDGISNTVLAQSLKILEENGLINRKCYFEIPPKVEYSLSKKGYDLLDCLNPLVEWSNKLVYDRN